jgi:hypothetical protein
MPAVRSTRPARLFHDLRVNAWPSDPAVRAVLSAGFALDTLTALVLIAYGSTYLVHTLEAPASYPAFALGLHGAIRLLIAAPAGWVVDNTTGAQAVTVAAALQATGLAIMLASATALGYLIGVVPLAVGTSLGWLFLLRSLGAAVLPDGRGAAGARLTIVSGFGIASGFVLASGIATLDAPPLAFVGGGALVALYATALRRAHAPRVHATRQRTRGEPVTRIEVVSAALMLAHFAAMTAIAAAVGPFALRGLGLTLPQAVLALLPTVVTAVGGATLVGRRSRQGGRLREASPIYALGAASAVVAALTSSAALFAVAALPLGYVVGATSPLASAMRIDVSRVGSAPGAVLGRLAVAEGLGAGMGPVLVGLVIEAASERAGLVAVAAAFMVAAALAMAGARLVRL